MRAEVLTEIAALLARETHVLSRFPELVHQQAANAPEGSAPCALASERAARGALRRGWIRWRNKPAGTDPCLLTLPAAPGAGCALASDGRRLLFGEGAAARIHDLDGGTDVALEGNAAPVTAATFSPDGALAATTARDGVLRLWDARSGALVHASEPFAEAPNACAFFADGVLVAVGLASGELGVVKTRGSHGQFALPAHAAPIALCCASPDGSRLVTGAVDGSVCLWRDGLERSVLARDVAGLTGGAFAPDGRRIALVGGNDPELGVWTEDGTPVAQAALRAGARDSAHAPGGGGGATCCAITPDGERLVVGCWDGSLRTFDAETLAERSAHPAHGEPVIACAVSPDGTKVVTRDRGGTIRCFDLALVEVGARAATHGGFVARLVVSADGRRVASASWDETWHIWEIAAASCVAVEPLAADRVAPPSGGPWITPAGTTAPREAGEESEAHSPDGTRRAVVAPLGRALTLLDGVTGAPLATLASRPARRSTAGLSRLLGVAAGAFSPDSRALAAVADDATVTLWRAADGALLGRFPTAAAGSAIAFVGDAELVAGDAVGNVYLLRYEPAAAGAAPPLE